MIEFVRARKFNGRTGASPPRMSYCCATSIVSYLTSPGSSQSPSVPQPFCRRPVERDTNDGDLETLRALGQDAPVGPHRDSRSGRTRCLRGQGRDCHDQVVLDQMRRRRRSASSRRRRTAVVASSLGAGGSFEAGVARNCSLAPDPGRLRDSRRPGQRSRRKSSCRRPERTRWVGHRVEVVLAVGVSFRVGVGVDEVDRAVQSMIAAG